MGKSFSQWVDFLYGPIFRVIGFFYRTYTANRARVARIRENAGVAVVLRVLAVLLLVGWILVWYFAPDESRDRLADEIRQIFGEYGESSGN